MDRWLHAQGTQTEDEFLIRTVAPRCIVALGASEQDGREPCLALLNHHDEEFSIIQWLDKEPPAETHEAILWEAIAANEAYTIQSLHVHSDEATH